MPRFLLFVCTLLVSSFSFVTSKAQTNRFSVKEIVREKIRVSPEAIQQATNAKAPAWLKKKEYNETKRTDQTRASNTVVSGSNDPESEVHAAINPTDSSNIVVSANSSGQSVLTDGLNPIYYTKTFGATWFTSDFKAKSDGNSLVLGGGDPMFVYDGNGTVYMSWINLHATFTTVSWDLFWASSVDGGVSWTKGTEPIAHSEASLATFIPDTIYDKQWMAVDRSNSQFENTVYCVFFEASSDETFGQISVRKKKPSMANFSATSVRASGTGFSNLQFSSIDVDASGGVHVTYFATVNDIDWALYHSLSTDGGATFGASHKVSDVYLQGFSYTPVADDSIVGVQETRLYPCPHVYVDKSSGTYAGRCYTVWSSEGTTVNNNNGLDIFISYSDDNGVTWSNAIPVNNDNTSNHNFYPSLTVSKNGVVVVTWYDRRSDANNLNTYYYLGYSFDGGNTFTTQLPVSDAGTDFSTVGSQSGGFGIGEYNQVLTTPTKAIPVWSDARGNDGQLDIYAAFLNIDPNVSVSEVKSIQNPWQVTAPQPNPTQDVVSLYATAVQQVDLNILVSDAAGKQLIEQTWKANNNSKLELSVKQLPAGIYTLRVSDNKAQSSFKFVKQ